MSEAPIIDPARLPMWVIYDHPTDFPDHFVGRLWFSLPEPAPTAVAMISPNIEALRAYYAECGFAQLGRNDGDDTKIVETWIC